MKSLTEWTEAAVAGAITHGSLRASIAHTLVAYARASAAPQPPADADIVAEMVPCAECGARLEFCACTRIAALVEERDELLAALCALADAEHRDDDDPILTVAREQARRALSRQRAAAGAEGDAR